MWKVMYYAPTKLSSEKTLQMLNKKGYELYGTLMGNANVFAIKDISIRNNIAVGSVNSFEYMKREFDSEYYIDTTKSIFPMDTE